MRSFYLIIVFSCALWCSCSKSSKRENSYSDYDYGSYYYWSQHKYDSAFFRFNNYVNNSDDTLKKGSAYKFMGEILWSAGDLYGAQENLIQARYTLDSANQNHFKELGYIFNILGNVSIDLKLYQEALEFYDRGLEFTKGESFSYELMNGKAVVYRKMNQYEKALQIYDSIFMDQPSNKFLLARIIDNRAYIRWLQNINYVALPEFWAALKIRTDSQYIPGLIASYGHLSHYYTKLNQDSALLYATKMFEKANEVGQTKELLEAIDKLVSLNNNPALKESWYQKFRTLSDSIQLSNDSTKSRYAFIKYDFQKTKAANLQLHRDKSTQQALIIALLFIAIVVVTGISAWYNKRRKRIKYEADKEIQESRLKTSQKIHDVVANELYGILNELEHGKSIEREPLLTRIEDLYEKSRDISYEEPGGGDKADYDKQIHQLLNNFISEQTEVFVVGNQPKFWDRVSNFQKNELLLVLKEIMTNMKKHSGADNVVIKFKQESNVGFINYSDDGKGFTSIANYGNGLKNTVNRIESLNGAINFGKSEKGGASIAISFPLEPEKL